MKRERERECILSTKEEDDPRLLMIMKKAQVEACREMMKTGMGPESERDKSCEQEETRALEFRER